MARRLGADGRGSVSDDTALPQTPSGSLDFLIAYAFGIVRRRSQALWTIGAPQLLAEKHPSRTTGSFELLLLVLDYQMPEPLRDGCRLATMQCSKLHPYSITSSARPDRGSGMVMPSVLAVLRLMYSSTFVACCTGRSAGFSPLRTRPV